MKKQYEQPIVEIEKIDIEDIITDSGVKFFNKYSYLDEDADFDWDFD